MIITREQAIQLQRHAAAAADRETDPAARADAMTIVNLLGELAKDMPDAEREYVSQRMPHSAFMYEKTKKLNGAVLMPSKPLLEND